MKINNNNKIEMKNRSYISPRLELIEIELEEVIAQSLDVDPTPVPPGTGDNGGPKIDYRTKLSNSNLPL